MLTIYASTAPPVLHIVAKQIMVYVCYFLDWADIFLGIYLQPVNGSISLLGNNCYRRGTIAILAFRDIVPSTPWKDFNRAIGPDSRILTITACRPFTELYEYPNYKLKFSGYHRSIFIIFKGTKMELVILTL